MTGLFALPHMPLCLHLPLPCHWGVIRLQVSHGCFYYFTFTCKHLCPTPFYGPEELVWPYSFQAHFAWNVLTQEYLIPRLKVEDQLTPQGVLLVLLSHLVIQLGLLTGQVNLSCAPPGYLFLYQLQLEVLTSLV